MMEKRSREKEGRTCWQGLGVKEDGKGKALESWDFPDIQHVLGHHVHILLVWILFNVWTVLD